MCGIAGVYYFDRGREVTRAELTPLIEPLRLRGPDAEVLCPGRGYGFALTRLAVIDPSPGAMQPYEANGHRVIFNGEIFNHVELRARWEQEHGARFHSRTDGEVLPWLLARDGYPLDEVRGMYAIADYQPREHRLVLLRDRSGEKPLYYAEIPGGLVFASSLAAVRRHRDVGARIDGLALVDHLAYGFLPEEETILSGARRLPPGGLLLAAGAGIELRPAPSIEAAAGQGAEEELEAVLELALAERLKADRAVGIFLSGGIDSALVAAGATRLLESPPPAFTARFGGGEDEVALARRSARALGVELEEVAIDERAYERLPALTRMAGEPIGDASVISLHALARRAAERVVVVLGGDGADEWFHGYDRYRFLRSAPAWALRRRASARGSDPPEGANLGARFGRGLALLLGRGALYPALLRRIGARSLGRLLRDDELLERWLEREGERAREFALLWRAAPDAGEAAARWDRRHYLVYDPLLKSDLATMAASLEARTPFLDPRVLALRPAHPPSIATRGKPELRALARRWGLPRECIRAKKRGFRTPLSSWFEALGGVRRVLAPLRSQLDSWVAREVIEGWIGEHEGGVRDHASRLHHLVALGVYLREFPAA